jgi:outer membrane protein OmpA-like peptidoglycan-associated protein
MGSDYNGAPVGPFPSAHAHFPPVSDNGRIRFKPLNHALDFGKVRFSTDRDARYNLRALRTGDSPAVDGLAPDPQTNERTNMKKLLAASACAMSVLLMAGCSAPLNRDTETSLNRAAGIEVAPVADGVAVKLPEKALFDFDKSVVRADASAVVDRSAVLLKRSKKPVIVEGYTDNVGTLEYNQQLSEARAVAVGYALVGRGVPMERIRTKGNAYNNPIASNDTPEGRALNRRTEIVVRGETMETLMGKK